MDVGSRGDVLERPFVPNLYWQAVPWENLRSCKRFVSLPAPSTVRGWRSACRVRNPVDVSEYIEDAHAKSDTFVSALQSLMPMRRHLQIPLGGKDTHIYFRQDTVLWQVLHLDVLTTRHINAALGFYEGQAGKRLCMPKNKVRQQKAFLREGRICLWAARWLVIVFRKQKCYFALLTNVPCNHTPD